MIYMFFLIQGTIPSYLAYPFGDYTFIYNNNPRVGVLEQNDIDKLRSGSRSYLSNMLIEIKTSWYIHNYVDINDRSRILQLDGNFYTRLTAKDDVLFLSPDVQLFAYDYIVIPIGIDNTHFSFCGIIRPLSFMIETLLRTEEECNEYCTRAERNLGCIVHLDPIDKCHPSDIIFQNLKLFLTKQFMDTQHQDALLNQYASRNGLHIENFASLLKSKLGQNSMVNFDNIPCISIQNIPRQPDGSNDCALFCTAFTECFIKALPSSTVVDINTNFTTVFNEEMFLTYQVCLPTRHKYKEFFKRLQSEWKLSTSYKSYIEKKTKKALHLKSVVAFMYCFYFIIIVITE